MTDSIRKGSKMSGSGGLGGSMRATGGDNMRDSLSNTSVMNSASVQDEELLKKVSKNIKENKFQYMNQFDRKSKGNNFVSHDDFQLIL